MKITIKFYISIIFSAIFCNVYFGSCEKDFSSIKEIHLHHKDDTTSHNFVWQFDTTGTYPSVLRDVCAIDQNNAWAVGEIYADSAQPWLPYNAVHWDGQQWELKRIPFTGWCSAVQFPPLGAIFAFSENDIWFSRGGSLVHYNGNSFYNDCDMNALLDGSINEIWGTDSNNLYAVGGAGSIVYYNGGNWQKFESGTDINLTDIWGSPNGDIIWACGFDDVKGSVLLRKTGSAFEKVLAITSPNIPHPPDQITHIFKSLWSHTADSVYIGSIGRVYIAPRSTLGYARELLWWDYDNEPGFPPATEVIQGNAAYDLFVAGFNRFVGHYNGRSWKRYPEVEGNGSWRSIACFENWVFLVGNANGVAVMARGYRN